MKRKLSLYVFWEEDWPIVLLAFVCLTLISLPGFLSVLSPISHEADSERTLQNSEPLNPSTTLDDLYAEKFNSRLQPKAVQTAQVLEPQVKRLLKSTTYYAVPVLMYHHISDIPDNVYGLDVPVNHFRQQIGYLHDRGFHTVTLAQLQDYLYYKKPLPQKPVLVTFDDGNKDNITTALPILAQYGFTATIFVSARFIGQQDAVSMEDIKTLAAAGWDIGNHTRNHPDLTALAPQEQKLEFDQCTAVLQQALPGQSILYFAYPGGKFNEAAIQTLRSDGFVLAFTTNPGWAKPDCNPYKIPRIYVGPKTTIKQFANKVEKPY